MRACGDAEPRVADGEEKGAMGGVGLEDGGDGKAGEDDVGEEEDELEGVGGS